MTLILTQLTSQNPPPVDTPDTLDSPLPATNEDASNVACLLSVFSLPGECLAAASNKLFGFYQYLVHQNPDTHLDEGIEEDGK